MENNRIYVSMMLDSLQRKRSVLIVLYEQTQKQEKLLKEDPFDADAFRTILDEKGERIEELETLDAGFDQLYQSLERELLERKQDYAEEIGKMKQCIADISDCSIRIQALEKKNSERFRAYLTAEKSKVKSVNMNQRTAMTYAQSMTGTNGQSSSYFFNEKK